MAISEVPMTVLQEKWAPKIAALLDQARSVAGTPEAEVFLEGAERLMAKYAIEQIMVEGSADKEREEIITRRIRYKSATYHLAYYELGRTIAEAQGCKVLISRWPNQTTMTILGFESDVERAIMLDSSLQLQMQAAFQKALRGGQIQYPYWCTTTLQKGIERREWMFGYVRGVRERLARANRESRESYVAEVVEAGGDRFEVSEGMELARRSRKDRLQDWYDESYGHLKGRYRHTTQRGTSTARRSGFQEGLKADTGSAGALKGRRALNR